MAQTLATVLEFQVPQILPSQLWSQLLNTLGTNLPGLLHAGGFLLLPTSQRCPNPWPEVPVATPVPTTGTESPRGAALAPATCEVPIFVESVPFTLAWLVRTLSKPEHRWGGRDGAVLEAVLQGSRPRVFVHDPRLLQRPTTM